MEPDEVPAELMEVARSAVLLLTERDVQIACRVLAAVLPEARKAWFAELVGTPTEVAARAAEAAQHSPDDTIALCEKARPGEHERRIRAKVATEIKQIGVEHRNDRDNPASSEEWACYNRAALVARGDA
jgi:hypothetical protein